MLVDEGTGEVKWAIQAHTSTCAGYSPSGVAMSTDGRFVASVGLEDDQWKLWHAASGAIHSVGARHDGSGACICDVPPLGHPSFKEGCPAVAHFGGLLAVAFSSCGQRLATGGRDRSLILWDARTGKRLPSLNPEPWTVSPEP